MTQSLFFAQQNQWLKGRVIDYETTLPIPGVKVLCDMENLQKGTFSDSLGLFKVLVPIGRMNIQFSLLGYENITLQQVLVTSGKQLDLQIELKPSSQNLEGVTITSDRERKTNQMATVSARGFNVEETQRYAASFNDPARMALSFAGVNTANDASNEIIVRGNSARGLLWRVEGIEIPNPNHFSNGEGGSGGGISILSSQILSNSIFYTGAFPGEFGNALSGVFDIKFRKGNADKREYSAQLGILGLQSSLEGPFSKKHKGSYLINYRYSTLIFLNAIGLPVVDNALVPQFQDLSYNFSFPTKKLGSFTIFGLGGVSTAGDLAEKDSSLWLIRSDRFQDKSYQFVGSTGITHTIPLKAKGYWKSVIAISREENGYKMDSLNFDYQPVRSYDEAIKYHVLRGHSFVNLRLNLNQTFRFGTYYSHYFYSIFSQGLNIQNNTFGTFSDETGNTGLVQLYGQHKVKLTQKFDLVSGLHSSLFVLNKNMNIEPRLGLTYQVNPRQSLNLGLGLHSRLEPVSIYLSRVYTNSTDYSQPNSGLNLSKSLHQVVGYELAITPRIRCKSEVYFQYLFQVPVDTNTIIPTSMLNANTGLFQNTWVNDGNGRNYGVELTLERNLFKGLYFMFTSSLFQSQFKLPQTNWLNTRFNANYMFNALGGYEYTFGKKTKKIFGINSRIIWRGGNRYTPINLALSQASGIEVYDAQIPYQSQLPDYLRIDLSALMRFNYSRWSLVFSTEIQNVTNRSNINRYYFDPYSQEIRKAYMFGIMPVFNCKIEF
ncbi:MAG: carboxypeptidase-like regulatory domain-containing protein [Bacteroidota bacterium]